jgi:transposase
MARNAQPVILTADEREVLESWQRRTTVSAGLARRARAILLLAEGKTQGATGKIVGMGRRIVRKWGNRFRKKRIAGLYDAERPGRPPAFSP